MSDQPKAPKAKVETIEHALAICARRLTTAESHGIIRGIIDAGEVVKIDITVFRNPRGQICIRQDYTAKVHNNSVFFADVDWQKPDNADATRVIEEV